MRRKSALRDLGLGAASPPTGLGAALVAAGPLPVAVRWRDVIKSEKHELSSIWMNARMQQSQCYACSALIHSIIDHRRALLRAGVVVSCQDYQVVVNRGPRNRDAPTSVELPAAQVAAEKAKVFPPTPNHLPTR